MKLSLANQLLLQGNFSKLNKFSQLLESKFQFKIDLGLPTLPQQPGLISIRGARQFGKSTWLESQIASTIDEFGVGSALYLNGDIISDFKDLITEIEALIKVLKVQRSHVKRIFIDEITAIKDWQRAIKYLSDTGELNEILIIATGSSAYDLRRGAERLPGRKGKLTRSEFIFPPVSYTEFLRVCKNQISEQDLLFSYLISGGSPIALAELATNAKLSDDLITLTRDWILGAIVASGRSREVLLGIMHAVSLHAGTQVGYNKLAQEIGLAGVANAQGYIEVLTDCLAISPSYAWDVKHHVSIRRKQVKFNVINLLAAIAFSKEPLQSVADFKNLSEARQGKWLEWLVAQEIFRKRCIAGEEIPELFNHFNEGDAEIDFVLSKDSWLEVKRGQASPYEFGFLPENVKLQVICANEINLKKIKGISLEEFLRLDKLAL